jgi:hypothetical protein
MLPVRLWALFAQSAAFGPLGASTEELGGF